MVCVLVIALTSLLTVRILDTETVQLTAIRNTTDYERALYLAGAAVHHVLAEIEADIDWRGTVTEGSYPADGSYSGAADGSGDEIVVTGTGVAGDAVRTLEATISLGG